MWIIIAIDDHADVIVVHDHNWDCWRRTEMDLWCGRWRPDMTFIVIATGENLESEMSWRSCCKALGVEHVIAKVKNEVTKESLRKIGADLVIPYQR